MMSVGAQPVGLTRVGEGQRVRLGNAPHDGAAQKRHARM